MPQPSPEPVFFARELEGETPLSLDTARSLCDLSRQLLEIEPWNALSETDLIFVRNPGGEETHACSVMGALGEVLSLHVYLGAEGYHHFQRLQQLKSISAADFFTGHGSVYAELVPRRELTKPDRDLLGAAGYPKGGRAPMFRAIRDGHFPWYVTEGEGVILRECLAAVVGLFGALAQPGAMDPWSRAGFYPLLVPRPSTEPRRHLFALELTGPPAEVRKIPVPAAVSSERVERALLSRPKRVGAAEIDHFHGAGQVGGKYQRKACIRMAIAIDAVNGFAYPPQVGEASGQTADLLAELLFGIVETARVLPAEIHVRNATFQTLLKPLADAFGIRVRAMKRLPAVDFFRSQLLSMMGDPGPIPLGGGGRRGR